MDEQFEFESYATEVTLLGVDPDLLSLVFGVVPETMHSVEVHQKMKRTFWQWLRRKPVQYQTVVIPRAQITMEGDE